ncbi:MAG TPA: hypothetical protein VJC18_03000, partial [bacterium]|nr:hypothetical protein [bacterium]
DDGKYLVTTGFHNLQGLLTKTSHPREAGSAFQAPQGTLGVANPMTQTAYDVFGKTISHTKDATLGTGSQAYTYAQPRVESFTDEEGYQKRVTRDAHGRAIKVERGKSGTYSTLATYAYDPANNLVSFTDGEGVQYTYSYDGASRLRAVKWSALSGEDNWYENTYRGTRKTRMQDLSGGYTNWEYDAIGRLKTMTVSDSLPDSPTGITTYEYTYDDEWIGALTKTTDPSGTTEYTYDEFGRSANVSRSYLATDVSGTESLTAEFVYDYDLRGNIVSKVYPSGRALTMEYDYGFLKKTTSTTSGAEDYSISYDYNKWGLLEKALSSHGHSFTNTFTTPLWVDNIAMTFGGTTYSRTFTWHKNGLLQKYKIDSGVAENTGLGNNALPKTKTKITTMSLSGTLTQGMGATKATAKNTATASSAKSAGVSAGISAEVASANDVHYQYAYDNLKQVITLTKEALSTVNAQAVEEYTYNTSGSITSSTDHSGKEWTYTYDTGKNRIAGRTSSAGDSEEFVYDNAGRVKTWRSVNGTYTYYYDGQGRLRGMVEGASWKLVLDYDASGALVRRANNNPYTSSPDYVYSFDAWRYDGKTKQVTELDNNLVSMEGGAQKWVLNNYDGQAARVFGQTGSALSERVVGVFGTDLTQTG